VSNSKEYKHQTTTASTEATTLAFGVYISVEREMVCWLKALFLFVQLLGYTTHGFRSLNLSKPAAPN